MPAGTVLITNETGVVVELTDRSTAGDDIEILPGLISPGFINTHCHLELSHLKGHIPERTGLVDFILKVVNERHFDHEIILEAIAMAETEMLENGIVAVGDICNNNLSIPQKSKGRLWYHNFIEISGFIPEIALTRFNRARTILEEYHAAFGTSTEPNNPVSQQGGFKAMANSTLSPHAPYSVSSELFGYINDFPDNHILTMHNQEVPAENDLFLDKTGDFRDLFDKMNIDISFFKPSGKSSLQSILPFFTNEQQMILVHNVATAAADIDRVPKSAYFCLCPNANLYISQLLPDPELFIKNGCTIVLGTDSLASNHGLSILEEMKTLQNNFPGLDLIRLLQWSTINGARALKMDQVLGSFEKGKQPGIILIEKLNGLVLEGRTSVRRVL